jgi:hypothetical protein
MSSLRRLLPAVAVMVLSGCESTPGGKQVTIRTEYDHNVNFPKVGTYTWLNRPPSIPDDPRINRTNLDLRVRDAVDKDLRSKGYECMGLGYKVDFLVTYHAVLDKGFNASAAGEAYGYKSAISGAPANEEVEKGSLVIDIVDPNTKRLIWRGIAQADIDFTASEAVKRERLYEAVRRILKQFPPR